MAQVNNVNGVILLPDNWDEGIYQLSNPNLHGANYNSNIITASEWNSMEASGVVFLPVAEIIQEFLKASKNYTDVPFLHLTYALVQL